MSLLAAVQKVAEESDHLTWPEAIVYIACILLVGVVAWKVLSDD